MTNERFSEISKQFGSASDTDFALTGYDPMRVLEDGPNTIALRAQLANEYTEWSAILETRPMSEVL